MQGKTVTIKDIAKALHISVSTVSRALRNSHDVGSDTKIKVMQLATSMGYQPNPIALALRNKKTYTIGVIVSEIANAFFSQVINGIEKVANDNNYNVVVIQTNDLVENEKKALNFLASRSIDGIIISLSAETNSVQHIQAIVEKNIPLVQFDKINEQLATPFVCLNNFSSTYIVGKQLQQQKITSVIIIAGSKKSSITNKRVEGIINALSGNKKIDVVVLYCNSGGWDVMEVTKQLEKKLINSKISNKKTTIVSMTDRLTYTSIYALKQMGIQLGKHLQFVGFSNADYIDLIEPKLSIIKQPANAMGSTCCNFLLQLIKKNNATNSEQHKIFEAVNNIV